MLLILPALAGGLVALSPAWIPLLARPLARAYGVQWERLEADGYASFAISGLQAAGDAFTASVDQLTIPQPLPWLAARLNLAGRTQATAGRIEVRLLEQPEPADPKGAGIGILDGVRSSLLQAMPWIPRCEVLQLEILDSAGDTLVRLDNLVLDGRALAADWPGRWDLPPVHLQVWLADDAIRLEAVPLDNAAGLNLGARLLTRLDNPSLSAVLSSRGIPLAIEAVFPKQAWLPGTASVTGSNWPVPGLLLARTGLLPDEPVADLDIRWDGQAYAAAVRLLSAEAVRAIPLGQSVTEIALSGNTVHLDVTAFSVQASWLRSSLTDPVRYSFPEKAFTGDARFSLEADLSGQNWFPATGSLRADISVATNSLDQPVLEFTLAGDDLALAGISISKARSSGSFAYPELVLREAQLDLDDTSHFSASGQIALDARTLEGQGSFILGPDWVAGWIPQPVLQTPLAAGFSVAGPFSALRHQGRTEPASLAVNGLHPLVVSGEWTGTGFANADLALAVDSDQGSGARVTLTAVYDAPTQALDISVQELLLRDAALPELALEQPCRIGLVFGPGFPLRSVAGLRLSGAQTFLSAEFDWEQALLTVQGSQVDLQLLDGWLERPLPPLLLERLSASVSLTENHLAGDFDMRVRGVEAPHRDLWLEFAGSLDETGIHVRNLEGASGTTPFVTGHLEWPALLNPLARGGAVHRPIPGGQIDGSLKVDLSRELAGTLPSPGLLEHLPEVRLDLRPAGTPDNPEISVEASLARLEVLHLMDERLGPNALDQVTLSARVSRASVEISSFQARLGEARVSARGDIPTDSLLALLGDSPGTWKTVLDAASLSLDCANLQAAAFSSLLPDFMRPTGRVDGSLTIRPGEGMSGTLQLRDFSMRPTLYSQPVTGIQALLVVRNQRLTLTEASASVSRSKVSLSGYLDFSAWNQPLFSLKLEGTRVPLLRTPDLLLVGDLDLALLGDDPAAPAKLSGQVRLRDSLMMLDIDPLAASTTGQKVATPPFFSVRQAPFAGWLVDVGISGEDSLRFKSPYAKALLSVEATLEGTLEHPVFVGTVFSSDGVIEFPGVRTSLSRSEIFVTRERQDLVQLDLNSMGQVASYVISVNVSGTTEEPRVTFASTPELSNGELFQLLATGSANRSGVSSVGLYLGRGLLSPGAGNSLWDRFSFDIGRDVTESSKDTIDLYYDFSESIRLHGEYDKYDARNLDLEWEVFKR